MTELTWWWGCLGSKLSFYGILKFIRWSLMARYQLSPSAAMVHAELMCLGFMQMSLLLVYLPVVT